MEIDRILRLAEVLEITGLSRSSLYRALREGRFIRPVELGKNSRGWRASEIQAWIASLQPAGLRPYPEDGIGRAAPRTKTASSARGAHPTNAEP